jgi:plasmid stability protein
MVTITLPQELETVVAEEAARKGTTAERLTIDVLRDCFLAHSGPQPQQTRAAASMQEIDLSEAEASSLEQALASGAARPKIKIAPLPDRQS